MRGRLGRTRRWAGARSWPGCSRRVSASCISPAARRPGRAGSANPTATPCARPRSPSTSSSSAGPTQSSSCAGATTASTRRWVASSTSARTCTPPWPASWPRRRAWRSSARRGCWACSATRGATRGGTPSPSSTSPRRVASRARATTRAPSAPSTSTTSRTSTWPLTIAPSSTTTSSGAISPAAAAKRRRPTTAQNPSRAMSAEAPAAAPLSHQKGITFWPLPASPGASCQRRACRRWRRRCSWRAGPPPGCARPALGRRARARRRPKPMRAAPFPDSPFRTCTPPARRRRRRRRRPCPCPSASASTEPRPKRPSPRRGES
mmetsp:Transcript_21835/g.77770  ORF Transcript_21835/g.77770 Transcript_21835/m.77770 type:complete len:321 (+) Transcript_21835:129-1091(+)